MDAETLYNEIITLINSKGLDMPGDADDALADTCRIICSGQIEGTDEPKGLINSRF